MSPTQRAMIVPVTLTLILLTALMGAALGTVAPYEWDMLLNRFRGMRIISVAPASNAQATVYTLDTGQPVMREVMLDLHLSEYGSGSGSTSIPVLLTSQMGAVEIPFDDSFALRMEFVPSFPYADDELDPMPVMSPLRVAER